MSYTPPALLPDGKEIDRQHDSGCTFQVIADRYGTSRQAAWKRWRKWKDEQRLNAAEELIRDTELEAGK